MKFLFFLLMLSIGFQVHGSWSLNDVSYLLPLPSKVGNDSLLRINQEGAKGNILPKLLVDRIPPLEMTSGRDPMDAALRVVSIRIDPCFVELSPERCAKQIRFVWQPIIEGPRQLVVTEDAALHSFYELTDEEFRTLLLDLKNWKAKHQIRSEGLPLQVLPSLQNPPEKNQALQDLLSVFLKYTGQSNLKHLTAMVLRGGGDMWVFMQFDILDGKLASKPIARIGDKEAQAFVNQVTPATTFDRVMVTPEPSSEDYFPTLVSPSANLGPEKDKLILNEMEILYRIENPKNFHANNMDCVSCHLAQPAKQWALRDKAHLNLQEAWPLSQYQNSRHNLQNTTPGLWTTHMLRGFGYFFDSPAISQRVINESAEVADLLNADFSETQ